MYLMTHHVQSLAVLVDIVYVHTLQGQRWIQRGGAQSRLHMHKIHTCSPLPPHMQLSELKLLIHEAKQVYMYPVSI